MLGIHEEHEKASISNKRLIFVFLVQVFLFLILIIRLFFLQIVNYDKYKNMSEDNRIKTFIIPPLRGHIFDRNNVQLTEYEQGVVDKLKATHGVKSNIKLLNKLNKEATKRALTFEEVAIRTKLNNILNNKLDVKTTDNTKSNNAHRKLRPYTPSETDSSSVSTNVGAIKNGTIDFGNRVKQFHYTIRRALQQSNGKVSLNACKAAAQVLAGKLGVNLRGELDKVGKNGVKSEDNVVGVNNAKARIITVKNSTDNITISHELAHSVYDDVLNIVYNGLVRTFNMGKNSTVTNTLSNNTSNNGQQNLQQFNEDVRKLYNKVKKL